jgi:glycosyltransferase involved in cell wall biosynthesis
MIKQEPLISVLICNYNYGKYIKESLDSVLAQKYTNTEIVIIDDGSSDNSVEVINSFVKNNPNVSIKVSIKRKNEGICFARNDAIEAAKGEFFVFLDSDDTVPPEYVSSLVKVALEQKADVVYGNVKHFGDETGTSDEPEYDPAKLLLDNYLNISTLVNRSKLKTHRFDTNLNRKSHEDYDFWVGLSLMGLKFVKAHDVYLNYRIQKDSRNGNAQDLKSRTLVFLDRWKYIIEKYRKQYSLGDEVIYAQLRYQVERIGEELSRLNTIVQEDLNPVLHEKEKHIHEQGLLINDYHSRTEELERQLEALRASMDYRAGHWLIGKVRKVKDMLPDRN